MVIEKHDSSRDVCLSAHVTLRRRSAGASHDTRRKYRAIAQFQSQNNRLLILRSMKKIFRVFRSVEVRQGPLRKCVKARKNEDCLYEEFQYYDRI